MFSVTKNYNVLDKEQQCVRQRTTMFETKNYNV